MPAVWKCGLCLFTIIVMMFSGLMAVTVTVTVPDQSSGSHNQDCDLNSERDRASIIEEIRAIKVDQASILAEINASKVDVLKKIQDSAGACTNQSSQGLRSASSLSDNCMPLLIQQNINGSNFFNRTWQEYKVGFNRSTGDYWLGNEMLYQLTKDGRYKLRFELQQNGTGAWFWAEYTRFIVFNETVKYQISVGGYSGNTGFDAMAWQDTMFFTTWDRDNDADSNRNCAVTYGGGFWHNGCHHCGVNMARSTGYFYWNQLSGGSLQTYQLQTTRMWLTCR